MAKHKAYSTYKPVRDSWLSRLPEHWHLLSLKRLLSEKVTDGPHETPLFLGEGIPFLSVDGIQNNRLVFEGCRFVSEEDHVRYSEKCKPQKGDVLLGKAASVGKVAYVDTIIDFNVWSPLAVMRPNLALASGKYIFYAIQSIYLQGQCIVQSNSNTQHNLGMGSIENLLVPAPTLDEQVAIADFLDHETAKIDHLIAKQEWLIELLKEKRQAAISHAVTKGLNPDAPMKDSGVEWMGDVPAHWDVRLLSSLANKITNGYVGPTRDIFVDDGVKYLQSLHIKNNKILFNTPYYVSLEWSQQKEKSILKEGDVLIVQTGDIGQVSVVPKEFEGANCHALIIVSTKKALKGAFLSWLLNSRYGFHSLKSIQTGALHPHLNCEYVRTVRVPLPPVDEQIEIVCYVEEKLTKFNEIHARATEMIGLLKEHRSALISSAVTGKIDVRDWQKPNTVPQETAAAVSA